MPQTSGLINARGAKPARPPPSPKGFVWPERKAFTREQREALAASLQELLAQREMTHTQLGKTLWGVSNVGAARVIKVRDWIQAMGVPPSADEAAYVAQVLDVPMARLLQPESAFNADASVIRPRGGAKKKRATARSTDDAKPAKKRRYRRRQQPATNGVGNGAEDQHDDRWTLANDMPRPQLRLQTSPERPDCVQMTLIAEVPFAVGLALAQMVHHNKAGPAREYLVKVLAREIAPMQIDLKPPAPAAPQLPSTPEASGS